MLSIFSSVKLDFGFCLFLTFENLSSFVNVFDVRSRCVAVLFLLSKCLRAVTLCFGMVKGKGQVRDVT